MSNPMRRTAALWITVLGCCCCAASRVTAAEQAADARPAAAAAVWTVGTPVVTYWAGPPMSEAGCRQMTDAGCNVVGCNEKALDLPQKHGLRGMLHAPLLAPATLDDPGRRAELDALIDRVRAHPAMYSYFVTD